MPRKKKAPSYRLNKHSGQAVVTLQDSLTGKRKTMYLGEHGSQESHEEYAAVVRGWETNGRRLSHLERETKPARRVNTATITELIPDYWRAMEAVQTKGELSAITSALRVLREVAGREPAIDFGPILLRKVRERMVERGWNRVSINRQVHRVRALFKWAASHEKLPVMVYDQLRTVEPLRKGRTKAPEPKLVLPVPEEQIAAVKKRVSRQVAALIDLQLLTGARAGELVRLRAVDLDTCGEVWTVVLDEHKTAHHNRARTIYLAKPAQAILHDFLAGRALDAPLFSPKEANAELKTAAGEGSRRPDQKPNPRKTERKIGETYTTASYRRAIERGCDAAGVPRWTPHRLRHTSGTWVANRWGLETARLWLGHSSITTTMIYAEPNREKLLEVAREIG